MENQELYEQWKLLDDGSLKGESYRVDNGEKIVTDTLDIRQRDQVIIYTAIVLNQNNGAGINFLLIKPIV